METMNMCGTEINSDSTINDLICFLDELTKSVSDTIVKTHDFYEEMGKTREDIFKNLSKNGISNKVIEDLDACLSLLLEEGSKLLEKATNPFMKFREFSCKLNIMEDAPKRIKEVNVELQRFGWYLSGSFKLSRIEAIYNLVDKYNKDKRFDIYENNINKIMNDFINKESENIIRQTLCNYPSRYKIIEDSYNAHKDKKYTLSVPVFLLQIDGICNEILNVSMYSKERYKKSEPEKKGKPQTKAKIECIIKDNKNIVKNDFIYLIFFNPYEITNSLIKKRSKFNRHRIIHGEDTNYYNETNSNKCISLFASLCDLKKLINIQK